TSLAFQLNTTVFAPGGLAVTGAGRKLFAVADDFDLAGGNTVNDQETLDGLAPTFAQCQVVLLGATLVTIPVQYDAGVRITLQVSRVRLQRHVGFRTQTAAVEFEIEDTYFTQSLTFRRLSLLLLHQTLVLQLFRRQSAHFSAHAAVGCGTGVVHTAGVLGCSATACNESCQRYRDQRLA